MSERRTKGPGVPELLLDACTSGDTAAVRRLHQKNMYAFPANTEDGEGKTPLIRAVDGGHTETVGALLELGAKVDHQQRDGSTALHLACGSGQAEVVSLLVKAGANILLSDGDGDTALTRAERCADGTAVANVRQLLEEVAQKQGAEQEAKAKAAQDAREAAERVAAKQAAEQEEALAAKAARRQAREAEAKAAQEKQAPEAVDRVRVNEAAGGDAKARKKPAAKGPDPSCAGQGRASSTAEGTLAKDASSAKAGLLQHDLDSMRAEFAKTLGEVEHERDELKAEVVRLREQVASQQRLMASHAELYEEVRQARMAHAMSVHAQLQPQSNPTMAPSAALSMI